jgi:hypothetical protein
MNLGLAFLRPRANIRTLQGSLLYQRVEKTDLD